MPPKAAGTSGKSTKAAKGRVSDTGVKDKLKSSSPDFESFIFFGVRTNGQCFTEDDSDTDLRKSCDPKDFETKMKAFTLQNDSVDYQRITELSLVVVTKDAFDKAKKKREVIKKIYRKLVRELTDDKAQNSRKEEQEKAAKIEIYQEVIKHMEKEKNRLMKATKIKDISEEDLEKSKNKLTFFEESLVDTKKAFYKIYFVDSKYALKKIEDTVIEDRILQDPEVTLHLALLVAYGADFLEHVNKVAAKFPPSMCSYASSSISRRTI